MNKKNRMLRKPEATVELSIQYFLKDTIFYRVTRIWKKTRYDCYTLYAYINNYVSKKVNNTVNTIHKELGYKTFVQYV